MTRKVAILGVLLLGMSLPASARAQFSAGGSTDLTAGGGGASAGGGGSVGGTGHPGKLGIGFSSHGRGVTRNVATIVPPTAVGLAVSRISAGTLAGKYFVTDRIALQLNLGFGLMNGTSDPDPRDDNDQENVESGLSVAAGPRAVYSAVRGDNSEIYLGFGVDVYYEDLSVDPDGPDNAIGWTATGLLFSVPVGFEIGFPGVPALRLLAEMSLSYVTVSYEYHSDGPPGYYGDDDPDADVNDLGTASGIILGSPGVDFFTLGLMYYF